MRFVVGLGNPGREFAASRHNVGFMVVERLAARWHVVLGRERHGLRIGTGILAGQPVTLVEPRRYMNMSGEALTQLEGSWHVPDIVVVHDDMDLAAGQLRVRHDGGDGGHRGVASLIKQFGRDFDRVRVGIGRPAPGMDPEQYVLMALTPAELSEFDPVIERAADAVECLVTEGIDRAMNRFNTRAARIARDRRLPLRRGR